MFLNGLLTHHEFRRTHLGTTLLKIVYPIVLAASHISETRDIAKYSSFILIITNASHTFLKTNLNRKCQPSFAYLLALERQAVPPGERNRAHIGQSVPRRARQRPVHRASPFIPRQRKSPGESGRAVHNQGALPTLGHTSHGPWRDAMATSLGRVATASRRGAPNGNRPTHKSTASLPTLGHTSHGPWRDANTPNLT